MKTTNQGRPPPDALRPARGPATSDIHPGKRIPLQDTEHDPARCVTCNGVEPWTERRRSEAVIHSLRSGRRIIDLAEVAR